MNDKLLKALMEGRFAICRSMDLNGKAPTEVRLFPVGKWEWNYDFDGPIEVTQAKLQEVVEVWKELGSHDVPGDYEHLSEIGISEAIASGWATGLEIREDGLYAKVDWTPAAKRKIEDKEYRYISPSFNHRGWMNQYTGAKDERWRMTSWALTNLPYWKELELAISKAKAGDSEMKKLLKLLGLPETATEEEAIKSVEALQASGVVLDEIVKEAETIKDQVELPEDQKPEVIAASLKDRAKCGAAVKTILKAAAKGSQEFVATRNGLLMAKTSTSKDVIERAQEAQKSDTSVQKQLDDLKLEQSTEKADALVARAKAEGKVRAADKDALASLREFAIRDFAGAEANVKNALRVVPVEDSNKKSKLPVNLDDVIPSETANDISARCGVNAKNVEQRAQAMLTR